MRFDYNKLKPFDFVQLRTKNWGVNDCIIIKNSRGAIEFLPTGPYEESDDMHFSYLTFEELYSNLEGYYFKEVEDIFLLLGKTDSRIINMSYRMLDDEGKDGWQN